jgi:hypothetical protein
MCMKSKKPSHVTKYGMSLNHIPTPAYTLTGGAHPLSSRFSYESNFIVPQSEQVHHWLSIKRPQCRQFQPILPFAGSNGVAPFPLISAAGGGFGREAGWFVGP